MHIALSSEAFDARLNSVCGGGGAAGRMILVSSSRSHSLPGFFQAPSEWITGQFPVPVNENEWSRRVVLPAGTGTVPAMTSARTGIWGISAMSTNVDRGGDQR